jgi:drug/metabolite transporter (DMT)-like permease
MTAASSLSSTQARFCLVLAAVLWSSGSFFMRFLRAPSSLAAGLGLDLHSVHLSPMQIACYRGLFGGLAMLLLVRRTEMRFRPKIGAMVLVFAVMSGLYMSALGLGPAANAIFLQNTAPIWVYLFGVLVWKESGDRRGWQSVLLGGLGAVVIVGGNWPRDLPAEQERAQVLILLMGLGSGLTYAGVMIFLRILRAESAAWLTALNLIGSAAVLALSVLVRFGPNDFATWASAPTAAQFVVLAIYGVVQMAVPYWLFARGLRVLSPQEAGIITLIEPLLNPVWAYLMTPDLDAPTAPMILGGSLILAALVWRYLPVKAR